MLGLIAKCQIIEDLENDLLPGQPSPFMMKADNLLLLWPLKTCLLCSIVFQRQQEPSLKIAGQTLFWLVMLTSWPQRQQREQVT